MIAARHRRIAIRSLRFLPSLAVALLVASRPARADCLVDYADCVDRASEQDTFVKRSLAGLGCFLDLISCLERRLA